MVCMLISTTMPACIPSPPKYNHASMHTVTVCMLAWLYLGKCGCGAWLYWDKCACVQALYTSTYVGGRSKCSGLCGWLSRAQSSMHSLWSCVRAPSPLPSTWLPLPPSLFDDPCITSTLLRFHLFNLIIFTLEYDCICLRVGKTFVLSAFTIELIGLAGNKVDYIRHRTACDASVDISDTF